MTDKEVKMAIQSAIKDFSKENLTDQAIYLFKTLGYNTERQNPFSQKNYNFFKESFLDGNSRFNEGKALVKEWKSVDLLFQLTRDEVSDQKNLFGIGKVKWEGEDKETVIETYLFFAIELIKKDYSRSALAQITREINKIFPMPVMLLFKYCEHITLSVINRRLNKKDMQRDVLEKVTLIKDISLENPHRAHIEILFDLSFNELLRIRKFTNFVELHNAWQKTLDTKELNKRFYQELSNWYFWAMDNVSFPDDVENNRDVRNSINLIRLITRIIFIWFIKEKNLVPDTLFDKSVIKKILKEFLKDKNSNSYYRAILQNLFFGTLNQKMGDRSFAKNGSFFDNKNEYGVKNLFRYDNLFAIDEKESLNLFKDVPFLNGGLFDCLDKPDDSATILYVDGFSRKPGKQANIPDFLFFADEQEIDLNKIYGTKNKKYKAKGLINILSNYKFTVTENTPIEEEIALDPELLGKVFENLLASYNPETQATARKQTGSFYTPREIVNYMVDESLKAYLKKKLTDKNDIKSEDADVALDFLFEYNEQEHRFNEKQTKALIEAIDTCKILDPACGSGAFPMGILHKFVHILHKLDPKNEQWKERQIQKACQIDDVTIREHSIADIESAFTNNELDYGRKLYLIENCIYGVDIQPIAVQIAKLRFFISLVVDQKKQVNEENLGIRALPNFETKFVAANTLIGLEKENDNWLNNQEIILLKKELKDIRHEYFSAKTRKEKLLFQKKDKDLRRKIKSILIEIQKRELNERISNSKEILEIKYCCEMIKQFKDNQKKRTEFETKRQKLSEILDKIKKSFTSSSEKTAKQLSGWDPYDQNSSSPFFDPEWMFGLNDGFDVVIGNPPYGILNKRQNKAESIVISNEELTYFKNSEYYKPAIGGMLNIFRLFILKSIYLLSNEGVFSEIFPLAFVGDLSISKLRNYILNNNEILFIEAFPERDDSNKRVFEAVKMSVCILNLKKAKKTAPFFVRINNDRFINKNAEKNYLTKSIIETIDRKNLTFPLVSSKETKLIMKIFSRSIQFIEIGKCNTGEVDMTFCKESFTSNSKNAKLLKGAIIDRYHLRSKMSQGEIVFIDEKKLFKIKKKLSKKFKEPKRIVLQGITGVNEKFRLKMMIISNAYCANSLNYLILKQNLDKKYLLGLFNSRLLNFVFSKFSTNSNVNGYEIDNLPIILNNKFINPISKSVEYTIFNNHSIKIKKNTYSTYFEDLIDAMVYELYFSEEIKSAGAEVLEHLTNLPELKDDWSDEKKLEVIEKVYKEISDPKHPVYIAMEKQKTVPEVRIIEGLPTLSEVKEDK